MPFVTPSVASTMDGSHPLTRPLFLYVNTPPRGPMNPAIMEFLKFVNSRDGQETVGKTGVYALPARQVQANLALLTGGTVPIDGHQTK